ncbi:MAG: hypothetical protein ACI8Z5_002725, partial [Lentimonas sp.]
RIFTSVADSLAAHPKSQYLMRVSIIFRPILTIRLLLRHLRQTSVVFESANTLGMKESAGCHRFCFCRRKT